MKLFVTTLLVLSLCSGVLSHLDTECATQELWEMRLQTFGSEAIRDRFRQSNIECGYGPCDDPVVRDTSIQTDLIVNIAFHIMSSYSGETPNGITGADLDRLFDRTIAAYQPYGISFQNAGFFYHNDENFFCIPAYSGGLFPAWAKAIDDMKELYAISPATTLNVFISCQDAGDSGTLNGIATFPWDSWALTPLGGLWINSKVATSENQDANDPVLFHELGHNFGLWHTFHGVSEVTACSTCAENVHSFGDAASSYVGDLCSDTLATPKNYDCAPPPGYDCFSTEWGFTDYNNMMGYARRPTNCRTSFSSEQRKRMHCWLCDSLSSQVSSGCF